MQPCYLQPFTKDQIRAISEYHDYKEPNTSLKDLRTSLGSF